MCPAMSVFVLLTALAACATDSASKAAEAYAHSMAPLLADDDELARKQIALAEGTTSGHLAAPDVAERYNRELVPEAGALRDRAKAIEPDAALPELQAPHALLVQAWTDRAAAYLEILRAYRAEDLPAFDAAAKKNRDAEAAEEQYFDDVEKVLAAHGATLR